MNPGPAPRPPTDRPRPNDPNTVAGSLSQMNLNSPSTPGLSTFPNNSTVSLSQTKTNQSGQGGVAVIKEGYVRCKEEKFLASWNQRYLVLREHRLDFLKNETGKVVLSIPLNTVTGVTRSEECRMAFEITRLANPKDATSRSALITRDVPTKTITCEVKSDDEIYDWIDKIYERCPGMGGVSNPTNFSHRVHVGFDPQTGAFVGLPAEWEKLLTASAITKEDYKKNPQAVIEVLEFYSDIKMREQNPHYYAGLAPPPSVSSSQSGSGTVGSSIAPPRPQPPSGAQRVEQKQSDGSARSGTSPPSQSQSKPSDADRSYEQQKQSDRETELADQGKSRHAEEDARRAHERQQQEEQNRLEQEAYNASLPKTRVPLAKQELGGYGASDSDPSRDNRFNPSRPAPKAPDSARQQPKQFTAQRPAPSPPTAQTNGSSGQKTGESPSANGQAKPAARTDERQGQTPTTRPQNNGAKAQPAQGPPPSRLPAPVQPVKPLNIANKQNAAKKEVPEAVRQAEAALTKKAEPRHKEVRMSNMSENEIMEKLRSVVSKENPNDSYSKQRKIGQGASGSVYVARVKENATSPVARELYRQHGPRAQVAIKQMDLRSQPRKELIVNEIIVMKDSHHANIVNFLDAFLQEQSQELWVVMEFMEGGALTDVIDNNPVIQEDQIAAICLEVSAFLSRQSIDRCKRG